MTKILKKWKWFHSRINQNNKKLIKQENNDSAFPSCFAMSRKAAESKSFFWGFNYVENEVTNSNQSNGFNGTVKFDRYWVLCGE